MKSISISGYGDDLTVNGVRIGDLTPAEHESIEKDRDEDEDKDPSNICWIS